MEESIKIQEEFENLITQLERLKNINELSSANTESAQKVISQIDKFILSTIEFKNKLELDLISKSDLIDKLITQLDKSINTLNVESQVLSNNIQSSLSIFKDETGSSILSLNETISIKIELLNKNFSDLEVKLIEKQQKIETNLIEIQTNQITTLANKIDQNKSLFINKLEIQKNETNTIKKVLLIICGLIILEIIVSIFKYIY